MWNLKYDINEPIYKQKHGHKRTDWWFPFGWRLGLGEGWSGRVKISGCKLLYIGWIKKVLLYNTGRTIFNIL